MTLPYSTSKIVPLVTALLCLVPYFGSRIRAATPPSVAIVFRENATPPIRHGLAALKFALKEKNVTIQEVESLQAARAGLIIVAGTSLGKGEAAKLITESRIASYQEPESLLIRKLKRENKTVLLVAGTDDRGLMYALLEVAERVRLARSPDEPLSEVQDAQEKPYTTERAVSMYTMNRAYWESRFYDEAYWTRYLDLLARNRFNSVVVIFGYENGGFLAPAYPYFFDVPEFPDVWMVGLTSGQQKKNLAALKKLIGMAHDRGLSFTVGFWDHIYRGGVQGGGIPGAQSPPGSPTEGLVWGVTTTNLSSYTQAGLTKFIQLFSNVDCIQFRMHDESGLKKEEQRDFWRNIFQVMKRQGSNIRFDARAKGLPDSIIEDGLKAGVNLRITTKYWMEQMGLPFHPTHINTENQFDRRHSYADMLRYPQRYKMHWVLWNGGTARVLLWGDPDYARRFVESTHLYDGDGYEVNEPLATKMEAQAHDAKPFDLLTPKHRYYDYEFERYWHFFQVFGRLGYNPNPPPAIWTPEFVKRFGPEAAPFVEKGLHRASQVLPRIVAACYPYEYFPTTRGWAEKQRLGDLPAYAKAEGSDIQQFASFDEEARMLIEDGETAKTRPPETSRWFARTAADITEQVAEAENRAGARPGKEFESTMTDLKILSNLALYHARRIPAAVSYRIFERTHDIKLLDDAILHEREAIAAWRQLVTAAGDFYNDDLRMGVRNAGLCGHWRDELTALEKGVTALEAKRRELIPDAELKPAPQYRPADATTDHGRLMVIHDPVRKATAGKPLTIGAEVHDSKDVKWVHLRYRSVNQREDYQILPMLPTGEKDHFEAVIPAEHIVPAWDFMYFIEVMDKQGNGQIYPDLNKETPYIVVKLRR